MRRGVLALALAFAGLPLLTACDDDPQGPAPPTITGSWEGVSNGVTFSMSLFEDEEGVVAGTGTASSATTSFPYDVTGGHLFPVVQLQLALLTEPDLLTLVGFVSFDSIGALLSLDGSVTGGGFEDFPIRLTRK